MKTSVYIGTSLDGFIAREDGNIEWLAKFGNEELLQSYNEFIKEIDAHVIGRGTLETVLSFPMWPYTKPVFVLSSSIKEIPETLKEKATVLSMKPGELLSYLSRKGFTNIYVDGGRVIQDFLKEDCIDELIITKIPLLLGRGVPLFGNLESDFEL